MTCATCVLRFWTPDSVRQSAYIRLLGGAANTVTQRPHLKGSVNSIMYGGWGASTSFLYAPSPSQIMNTMLGEH